MNFMTKSVYGLIGYPLSHSFSAQFFSEKFAREGIADASYELLPLPDPLALPALLRSRPEIRGLNVTIPHKQAVISLLDALDPAAQSVGAVNCIRIGASGQTTGFNTDIFGFERSPPRAPADTRPYDVVWREWAQREGMRAWVMGTGGAARAVVWVLEKYGISHTLISRTPGPGRVAYADLNALFDPTRPALLVNTTPAGMYPHTDGCPFFPYDLLRPHHAAYDLIYNPAETLFLKKCREAGCLVKNGLDMLVGQAEASWEIWRLDDA